jgi:protein TonB
MACFQASVRTFQSQSLSIGLHIIALGFGFLIGSRTTLPPAFQAPRKRLTPIYLPRARIALAKNSHTSGGASAAMLPARRGAPPPRAAHTFIPPIADAPPKLPLPISIDYDVPVLIQSSLTGDPLSGFNIGSLGRGGHGGIGNGGCCGGIGDNTGPPGLDVQALNSPITPPRLIYKVEPEFSEEARKAKFQGTVVLSIEVDQSGHTRTLQVLSSPGLGLDLKAIEAVLKWRFRPALRDGKPVVTSARVELNFRLL